MRIRIRMLLCLLAFLTLTRIFHENKRTNFKTLRGRLPMHRPTASVVAQAGAQTAGLKSCTGNLSGE